MKFGRRNFLKGLSRLAAAWMVKPVLPKRELPKLEDPLEEEVEEKEENDDVEQKCYDLELTFCDEDEKWPVSCGACHMYACFSDCPRYVIYPGYFAVGPLKEQ